MAKDPKCVNVKCLNSWGTHLNCLLNLKQIGQKKMESVQLIRSHHVFAFQSFKSIIVYQPLD